MANKALLVGVNRFKLPGSDLQGCVNDVTNVRDVLLKYFGFTVKQIRVLADGRATRKAILDRLNWLVKDARSGDRLLFHFSGHGSQIRDRDNDDLKNGLDEIICPHDMNWNCFRDAGTTRPLRMWWTPFTQRRELHRCARSRL